MAHKLISSQEIVTAANYGTYRVGKLSLNGVNLDIVVFNSNTSELFNRSIKALVATQDEYSYDQFVKIKALYNNNRSLLFVDSSSRKVVGQFCCLDLKYFVSQNITVLQPIFLIVHPDYQGKHLAKAFTLAVIDYNLHYKDKNSHIDYIQLSPYHKVKDAIRNIAAWISTPITICPISMEAVSDYFYMQNTDMKKIIEEKKKELGLTMEFSI